VIAHPPRPADCIARLSAFGDLHCEEAVADWYAPKLTAAIDIAAGYAPDVHVQLGDVAGGHDTAHLWTPAERRVYMPVLRSFSTSAPTVFLTGNHDGEGEWHHALAATFPIHVATAPGPIRIPGRRTIYVWALPYPHRGHMAAGRSFPSLEAETEVLQGEIRAMLAEWGEAIAELRQEEPGAVHVVATHCDWRGAVPGGGEVRQVGGDLAVTPADLVATGADLIIGGHIHGAQALSPRCLLAGSTRHLGHGETGETRYHWIIDICSEPRASDIRADDDGLQFVWSDARGSVIATGLPTGAPRWMTVKARWTGARFEHDAIPARAAGAEVRIEVEVAEEHADTCPRGEAARRAVLGALPVFGCRVTTKIARAPRELRAPEMLTADREDPVALLRCYVESRGGGLDREQEKRIRRDIVGTRDPLEALAQKHPAIAAEMLNAARRS
jgi:hypothetical protein